MQRARVQRFRHCFCICISDILLLFIVFHDNYPVLSYVENDTDTTMLHISEAPTKPVNFSLLDDEGFLINPDDWTRAFTEQRAQQADVELTEQHWVLIELIRDKYLRLGSLPLMRSVCKAVGFERSALKKEFGSCLSLWKMAGLPNPGEEAKTYMN